MLVIGEKYDLRHFFEEAISLYYEQFPQEAAAVEAIAAEQTRGLRRSDGHSPEGNFMIQAAIPRHLFTRLRDAASAIYGIPDLWADPKKIRFFAECWQSARIKRKPKARLFL